MRTTLIVLAAIATVTTGAMAFGGGGGGDGFGLGGPNLGDGYGRPSPPLGGPNGRRDYQFQYRGFAHKGGSWRNGRRYRGSRGAPLGVGSCWHSTSIGWVWGC